MVYFNRGFHFTKSRWTCKDREGRVDEVKLETAGLYKPSTQMRRLKSVASVAVLLVVSTLAQHAGLVARDDLSPRQANDTTLPTCAADCLLQTLESSLCGTFDESCVCASTTAWAQTASCVSSNCSVREALQAKAWQADECNLPVRSQSAGILALTWVLYGAALIAILMRLLARLTGCGFSWDDGIAAGCMLLLTALAVPLTFMVVYGLGQDIWTVKYDAVYNFFELFFVNEVIYVALNGFIKISILLLYLRIFPKSVSHDFRYLCWAMIFLCAAYVISNCLVFIFQCSPVSYAWTSWDGQHQGHCIDIQAYTYASIAINIGLEVAVFILPIPRLLRIDMSLRKKIVACLTFTVGFIVTGCSIARAVTLPTLSSTNPTWDFVRLAELSMAESSLGIICACLPPAAHLLRKMVRSKREYAEGGSPFSSKRNSRMGASLDLWAAHSVQEVSPTRTEIHVTRSWEHTTQECRSVTTRVTNWRGESRDSSKKDDFGLEPWRSGSSESGSERSDSREDDHEAMHKAAHAAHLRFGGVVQ